MLGTPDTTDRPGARSFRLPAPLLPPDDVAEKSVLSPFRHSSPVLAGSPRTATTFLPNSLLAPNGSHGSGSSSPKTAPLHKVEGGRFEDPLLSMPAFRRNSAAEAGCASPLTRSPSIKASLTASNSFSARRATLEFRRSLPGSGVVPGVGASAGVGVSSSSVGGSPADLHAGRNGVSRESRGPFETGQGDGFPAAAAYASPKGGSESGTRGGDEEDDVPDADADMDAALRFVGRQRSFSGGSTHLAAREPGTGSQGALGGALGITLGGAAGVGPNARGLRSSLRHSFAEEEDFMARLQQNRASWRERGRSGVGGGGGGAGAGGGGSGAGGLPSEGLQNQTHAALQQLRGELKSLSVRSMHVAMSGGGGGTAGASNGSHAGVPLSPPGQQVGSTAGAAGVGAVAAAAATSSGLGASPSFGKVGAARNNEGYVPVSPSRLSMGHSPGVAERF